LNVFNRINRITGWAGLKREGKGLKNRRENIKLAHPRPCAEPVPQYCGRPPEKSEIPGLGPGSPGLKGKDFKKSASFHG
jgi:hypothetical protein